MPGKNLSVVLPIYACEACIDPLYFRLSETLQNMQISYELIFVDDSSPDRSWEILTGIAARDPQLKLIRHSSNCGQHSAITSGLQASEGQFVVVMDADLQDPPELIPVLLKKQADTNAEIVLTARKNRSGPLWRQLASLFLRKFFPLYTRFPNGLFYGSYFLINRYCVNAYLNDPDRFYFSLKVLDRISRQFSIVYYRQDDRPQNHSSYKPLATFRFFCRAVGSEFFARQMGPILFLTLVLFTSSVFLEQACMIEFSALFFSLSFASLSYFLFLLFAYRNAMKKCFYLKPVIAEFRGARQAIAFRSAKQESAGVLAR